MKESPYETDEKQDTAVTQYQLQDVVDLAKRKLGEEGVAKGPNGPKSTEKIRKNAWDQGVNN